MCEKAVGYVVPQKVSQCAKGPAFQVDRRSEEQRPERFYNKVIED